MEANTETQANKSANTDSHQLAFMSLYETEAKDGYLGAILITDSLGIPQEFRCTHPVKPTAVQKSLYGDTLLPHICVNLCGIPLLKAIQSKPSLILLRDELFLGITSASPCPVVVIRRAGTAIDVRSAGDNSSLKKTRLESPVERFQPIVIEGRSDDSDVAKHILEGVFTRWDPLEPFDRINSAIQLLSKYDKKFQ